MYIHIPPQRDIFCARGYKDDSFTICVILDTIHVCFGIGAGVDPDAQAKCEFNFGIGIAVHAVCSN